MLTTYPIAPHYGGLNANIYFSGYRDGTCIAGELISKCFAQECSQHQSLTERELLAVHAEIKALQQQHGLSYKDAAHRLYHSEVQKLRVEDDACKVISGLREHIDILSTDISNEIKRIDKSTR